MREPGAHCCRTAGRHVVGIDEVGRGCLAGHVTAAAVWFPDLRIPEGVDDSKKVPERKRDALAYEIRQTGIVSIGHASVAEIDKVGILRATLIAMTRAWVMLAAPKNSLVLIDGDQIPDGIDAEIRCVPGADASCPTVAAASIIAKVDRDQQMRVLAGDDDIYGWKKNKGYGTAVHMLALHTNGAGPHHRRSFAPVARVLKDGKIG